MLFRSWQLLTQEKKAQLKYIDIDDNGELMLDQLDDYLSTGKVKLVTFSHMSNVLGTISPVKEIALIAIQNALNYLLNILLWLEFEAPRFGQYHHCFC